MENSPGINMAKQDKNDVNVRPNDVNIRNLQAWTDDIKSICTQLVVSSNSFNVEQTYKSVEKFVLKHKRWLYSTVSSFLFDCDDKGVSTFISNLDGLRDYAYQQVASSNSNEEEMSHYMMLATAIDKLWDHSNLAQAQNQSLHENDDTFRAKFNKNLIPCKCSITTRLAFDFVL